MDHPALTETTYYILPMESGSRKKEYQLTSAGLKVLKQELVRLEELAANGRAILQEEQV